MEHSSWTTAHGAQFMEHSSWTTAHGAQFMDHSSWSTLLAAASSQPRGTCHVVQSTARPTLTVIAICCPSVKELGSGE